VGKGHMQRRQIIDEVDLRNNGRGLPKRIRQQSKPRHTPHRDEPRGIPDPTDLGTAHHRRSKDEDKGEARPIHDLRARVHRTLARSQPTKPRHWLRGPLPDVRVLLWLVAIRRVPAQHKLLFEPGYGFNYSNFGLEQLALAMRNISGMEVGRYAWERILREIGMPLELCDNFYREMPYSDERELNYSDQPGWGVDGSTGCNAYGANRSSSSIGYNTVVGSTFRCSARDFARLGYLWLRKGRWDKRQLVPEKWINQATTRFKRPDGSTPMNYGYTFWMQDEWDGVPMDTFASRGHNVNDCYVIPSLDLVIARLGNNNPQREQRDILVKDLLSGVVRAVT